MGNRPGRQDVPGIVVPHGSVYTGGYATDRHILRPADLLRRGPERSADHQKGKGKQVAGVEGKSERRAAAELHVSHQTDCPQTLRQEQHAGGVASRQRPSQPVGKKNQSGASRYDAEPEPRHECMAGPYALKPWIGLAHQGQGE